jgi:hypothetical protein
MRIVNGRAKYESNRPFLLPSQDCYFWNQQCEYSQTTSASSVRVMMADHHHSSIPTRIERPTGCYWSGLVDVDDVDVDDDVDDTGGHLRPVPEEDADWGGPCYYFCVPLPLPLSSTRTGSETDDESDY